MTNIVFSPTLQAPIGLSNPAGSLSVASDPSAIIAQANPIPLRGQVSLVGAAVRLALAMSTLAGALSAQGYAPSVIAGLVSLRAPIAGSVTTLSAAPALTVAQSSSYNPDFPRKSWHGTGGTVSDFFWNNPVVAVMRLGSIALLTAYGMIEVFTFGEDYEAFGHDFNATLTTLKASSTAHLGTRCGKYGMGEETYLPSDTTNYPGYKTWADVLMPTSLVSTGSNFLAYASGSSGTPVNAPDGSARSLVNIAENSSGVPYAGYTQNIGQTLTPSQWAALYQYYKTHNKTRTGIGALFTNCNPLGASPLFDFVDMDNIFVYWGVQADILRNGTKSPAVNEVTYVPTYSDVLANGQARMFSYFKSLFAANGTSQWVSGNSGAYARSDLGNTQTTAGAMWQVQNCAFWESVMGKSSSTGTYASVDGQVSFQTLLACYQHYLDFLAQPKVLRVNLTIPNGPTQLPYSTTATAVNGMWQWARHFAAFGALNNGFPGIQLQTSAYNLNGSDLFFIDEYDNAGSKLNWLGPAIDPPQTAPYVWADGSTIANVYARRFRYGLVICVGYAGSNALAAQPTGTVTITGAQLGIASQPLNFIAGIQAPAVNTGAAVTSAGVTLRASRDGISLPYAIAKVSGQLQAGHYVSASVTGKPLSATRVMLRPDSETNAYAFNRNYHPNVPYTLEVPVEGGALPHWYEQISGPAGSTIGQLIQAPQTYGQVNWTPNGATAQQTFVERVHDQDELTGGLPVDVTWTAIANVPAFIFVDSSVNGSDTTGTGSIAKPYATLGKAFGAATGGKLICCRGGTYNFPATAQVMSATTFSAVFAYPGESVTFNCNTSTSNGGCFVRNGSDLYVFGIVLSGGPSGQQNPRMFTDQNVGDRHYTWGCTFDSPPQGTAGAGVWDNQACDFYGNGGSQRKYIYIGKNTYKSLPASGNGYMGYDLYNTQYFLSRLNYCNTSNSGQQYMFFHKGGGNLDHTASHNTLIGGAASVAQWCAYFGSDGSGTQSDRIDAQYNLIVNTSTSPSWQFAMAWNNGQNNNFSHSGCSIRNTIMGIPMIAYNTTTGQCTVKSVNDVIVNDVAVSGVAGKYFGVNFGGSANSFISPYIIPNTTFTNTGTECQGGTSAGILDVAYKLSGTYRTNYLGLRGAEIA